MSAPLWTALLLVLVCLVPTVRGWVPRLRAGSSISRSSSSRSRHWRGATLPKPSLLVLRAETEAETEIDAADVSETPRRVVGVFNTGALNISSSNPFGAPCSSVQQAKDELISVVLSSMSPTPSPLSEFERFRIDYLVKYLEATHVPIQTGQFLSLALGGEWSLAYSNALLPRADPSLITSVTQEIAPAANNSHGHLVNKISWRLDRATGDAGSGVLEVRCDYAVSTKGALNVALQEHVLSIEQLPLDAEEVIMTMQRCVPFQTFDPDGAAMQTTFVDPWLRVTRISGELFHNLFEIHTRRQR